MGLLILRRRSYSTVPDDVNHKTCYSATWIQTTKSTPSLPHGSSRPSQLTIEIDRSRTVGVDFLDHHVQVLLGQLVVQLPKDLAQAGGGNEAVSFLVVQTEGLFQLLVQGFLVLLNDELGR